MRFHLPRSPPYVPSALTPTDPAGTLRAPHLQPFPAAISRSAPARPAKLRVRHPRGAPGVSQPPATRGLGRPAGSPAEQPARQPNALRRRGTVRLASLRPAGRRAARLRGGPRAAHATSITASCQFTSWCLSLGSEMSGPLRFPRSAGILQILGIKGLVGWISSHAAVQWYVHRSRRC
eukprot:gene15344-biopygen7514